MPSTIAAYTPTPDVSVGGQAPDGFPDVILSALVEETAWGLARCEVCVDNWGVRDGEVGYVWDDRSAIDFGADLAVTFGPPDERATVFAGKVSALECAYPASAGATFTILAEDKLHDLRLTRRTRVFENTSDADIVEKVANDHNLTPDIDLDGPTHNVVAQVNQSDLAFVRDRALPLGADVWLDGTTLHVAQRNDRDPLVLRYGRELLELRVVADLADQCTEQRVAGWDVSGKTDVSESADDSAIGVELGSDTAGGSLLRSALGDRVLTTTLASATSSDAARALARGLYVDRARRFVTGTGTSDGIPALRVGRSVTLAGLGKLFDGTYALTRVQHRYDRDSGYRTVFDVARPGIAS